MQHGTRCMFCEMLPMHHGARFAVLSGFGRTHLVGLDWSVCLSRSGVLDPFCADTVAPECAAFGFVAPHA